MFDINTQLKTLRRMKDALEKAGLNREIMCQPPGYLCPEVENTLYGQPHLPEGPLRESLLWVREVEYYIVNTYAI